MFLSSDFWKTWFPYMPTACIFSVQKIRGPSHTRLRKFLQVIQSFVLSPLTHWWENRLWWWWQKPTAYMIRWYVLWKVRSHLNLLSHMIWFIKSITNAIKLSALLQLTGIEHWRSSHQEVVYSVYLLYYYCSYDWLHYTVYHNPHIFHICLIYCAIAEMKVQHTMKLAAYSLIDIGCGWYCFQILIILNIVYFQQQ